MGWVIGTTGVPDGCAGEIVSRRGRAGAALKLAELSDDNASVPTPPDSPESKSLIWSAPSDERIGFESNDVPPSLNTVCKSWLPGETPKADRKSTRLNSSHMSISYAVFCL